MTDAAPTASALPAVADLDAQAAAYARCKDEIAALPRETWIPINVEVSYAVSVALATADYLETIRDRIERQAHEVDTVPIWKLRDYAFSASYTNADSMFAVAPPETLPALHDEGMKLKEFLVASAVPLSLRGLLPNESVTQVRNPASYRNLAEYLTALARLYTDHWDAIAGKSPVERAEVLRASELAAQLYVGVGIRARDPVVVSAASAARQAAFTLLVKTYDQVRRLVSFFRWNEGDAEQLAPSMYGGRGNSNIRKKDTGTDLPPPAPDAAAPVADAEPDASPDTGSATTGLRSVPAFMMGKAKT